MVLGRVGMIEPSPSEIDESLQALDEARSLMEPIAHANAKSAEIAAQLAMILEYQGYRQEALGKHSGAMASCKGSMESVQQFLPIHNVTVISQYIAAERGLALLHASSGDREIALEFAQRALDQTEAEAGESPTIDAQMVNLASAWATLALTQARVGEMDDARRSAQKAADLWNSIKQVGLLSVRQREKVDTRALLDPIVNK
jgi:tetratricopeptide (TPR) repeat protein